VELGEVVRERGVRGLLGYSLSVVLDRVLEVVHEHERAPNLPRELRRALGDEPLAHLREGRGVSN
jgi:hypothetical protein